MIIKNFDALNKSPERELVLKLVDAALEAISPRNVFSTHFSLKGNELKVLDKDFNLDGFERIHLLGFGKGSAGNLKIIEEILGDKLTDGFDIDVEEDTFKKVNFTLGTHPLPSLQNVEFTKKVVGAYGDLDEKDLVLMVTCGGGSALFELPTVSLSVLIDVGRELLHSGANIHDMNVVRKHLSKVKGGGLARILHPATVINLVFSDVPGNDLSVIASGPTVLDPTSKEDAWDVFCRFGLDKKLDLAKDDFGDTPTDEVIFKNVHNIIFLSNLTALSAMQEKAKALGHKVRILTDRFQGDALLSGEQIMGEAGSGEILLAGGETTLKVKGGGEGGRNQELVLAVLDKIGEGTVFCSFDSDGWDNGEFAGAIGDFFTQQAMRDLNLDPKVFLNRSDSFNFFKVVGSGIETGRLPSNVSDLMIVYKK